LILLFDFGVRWIVSAFGGICDNPPYLMNKFDTIGSRPHLKDFAPAQGVTALIKPYDSAHLST
jgi:hypothetical protein